MKTMKKIFFLIACVLGTSSAIFAAKSDCGEYAQSYYGLLNEDPEYLNQWKALCNHYASTLSGDDRFFWLQYKDSGLWHDFVVSYSSSFCSDKYFNAEDRTIIAEHEKLSQSLDNEEFNFEEFNSAFDNYIATYISWRQNQTDEEPSIDAMPHVDCTQEYRKSVEKMEWLTKGWKDYVNELPVTETEKKQLGIEIAIMMFQSAKVGQEAAKLLSELDIVLKHFRYLLDDLFADKKGIEKTFATIFGKYKKQTKLDPKYRDEDLLLTYEDLLLQVLTLNGGNSLFKTYSDQLRQRLSAPLLLASISEDGANADKIKAMSDDYFTKQALKDFANVMVPYFKKEISKNDLQFVKDSIFSDKRYRTITDSVLFLSDNAMIYDEKTETKIYNVDTTNSDYWELHTELKVLFRIYNLSLTFGSLETADSLFLSYIDSLRNKVDDEWLRAYWRYTLPEITEQMQSFFNFSLSMACKINPQLKEDLTDEKYNTWYGHYCIIGTLLTLPEYRLVASKEDLEYLTELKEKTQYKDYVNATANILKKFAQMDESFWCTIATSMSNYMQANYKDSPAEVKLFKDGADQICAALK